MNQHIDYQRKNQDLPLSECMSKITLDVFVSILAGMSVHTGYVGVYACGKYVQQSPRNSQSSCDSAGL